MDKLLREPNPDDPNFSGYIGKKRKKRLIAIAAHYGMSMNAVVKKLIDQVPLPGDKDDG